MAEREDKVVIVREGGGGAIVAVVLLIAVLVGLFLLFGQDLLNGRTPQVFKADIDITAPAAPAAPTK